MQSFKNIKNPTAPKCFNGSVNTIINYEEIVKGSKYKNSIN